MRVCFAPLSLYSLLWLSSALESNSRLQPEAHHMSVLALAYIT